MLFVILNNLSLEKIKISRIKHMYILYEIYTKYSKDIFQGWILNIKTIKKVHIYIFDKA